MKLIIKNTVLWLILSVMPVFVTFAKGHTYWQEYGPEHLISRLKDSRINPPSVRYALPDAKHKIYFIGKNLDQAEIKLVETLLMSDQRLNMHEVKIRLIDDPQIPKLTIPVGIDAATPPGGNQNWDFSNW